MEGQEREGGLRRGRLSLPSIAAPYRNLLHHHAPRVGKELLHSQPCMVGRWEGPRPVPPHPTLLVYVLSIHALEAERGLGSQTAPSA